MAAEEGGGSVYVAVGKAVEKGVVLLQWAFRMFQGQEICVLYVHRPSPFIPTLLGKLPASQANPEMVSAFRNEETKQAMELLSNYSMTCRRARVKASIITIESDEVQKGIIDLVNLHNIKKLVIGDIPDSVKGKKRSRKASHAAKHAPSYCEIWFVKKGKLISTQKAFALTPDLKSWPLDYDKKETDDLCIKLEDLNVGVDESNDKAYVDLLENKSSRDESVETINKVKALEAAYSHEVKLRTNLENALKITLQEQEKLLEERDKITHHLQKTMRSITLLDARAQEANHRRAEVSGELRLIRSSVSTLRQHKQKLQWQKIEGTRWLEQWRNDKIYEDVNERKIEGFLGNTFELPEFSLSDLEAATCGFSESFRIGQGAYGVVYKGEMLDKTVAVKKLHAYNMQRQTEFHRAVQVLGKLRHPHLVDLIGLCSGSSLLVYEYLSGGSLQNQFIKNKNISPLNWKTRARIVSDIASALLFLHSFKPEKIIHGNLKPENCLLDSENRCKISDCGEYTLISRLTLRSPSFRGFNGSTHAFSYEDPESHRTGKLTHKSDIYSFGLIILQLVTGKSLQGLVGEVRRSVSSGKVASILDLSAGDWSTYVARRLVELGLECCKSNGRDRPEVTLSLVKELDRLHLLEEEKVPPFFLCPILKELMHDPQMASDGFTYEGEALRGWFQNGHETSPMTNLKLDDLNLTPNHALRFAIQDWLCKT